MVLVQPKETFYYLVCVSKCQMVTSVARFSISIGTSSRGVSGPGSGRSLILGVWVGSSISIASPVFEGGSLFITLKFLKAGMNFDTGSWSLVFVSLGNIGGKYRG
mgnify:CR=1 FL=1|jgi:hypothetical protein